MTTEKLCPECGGRITQDAGYSWCEDCAKEFPLESSGCIHHWEIAAAEGPISVGVCRRCRETREFSNSIPGNYF